MKEYWKLKEIISRFINSQMIWQLAPTWMWIQTDEEVSMRLNFQNFDLINGSTFVKAAAKKWRNDFFVDLAPIWIQTDEKVSKLINEIEFSDFCLINDSIFVKAAAENGETIFLLTLLQFKFRLMKKFQSWLSFQNFVWSMIQLL